MRRKSLKREEEGRHEEERTGGYEEKKVRVGRGHEEVSRRRASGRERVYA